MLTGLCVPSDILIVICAEAILIPMALYFYAGYKDAKILHATYERALKENTDKS